MVIALQAQRDRIDKLEYQINELRFSRYSWSKNVVQKLPNLKELIDLKVIAQ
jgi:hypothetical protein